MAENAEVVQSSGYRALEREAIRATRQAQFQKPDGAEKSVPVETIVIFRFKLLD